MFDKTLITVWSAPNYCYRCGNEASIVEFKSVSQREITNFRAVSEADRVVPSTSVTPYFL